MKVKPFLKDLTNTDSGELKNQKKNIIMIPNLKK